MLPKTKGKYLDVFIDLNLDHHRITFRVLWGANHVDGRKLFVAIQGGVSPGSRGFLKSSQISVSRESATDIVTEPVSIIALIQQGERYLPAEWPFEPVIQIPLHHANKQANVSSISTINSFREDTHEELVPTWEASVNRRTLK